MKSIDARVDSKNQVTGETLESTITAYYAGFDSTEPISDAEATKAVQEIIDKKAQKKEDETEELTKQREEKK